MTRRRFPTGHTASLMLTGLVMAYFAAGKAGFEPRLALGPVSLNQVLQVVVLATGVVMLCKGRLGTALQFRTVQLALLLVGMLIAGLFRSDNVAYGMTKTWGLAIVVLPCLLLLASSEPPSMVRRVLSMWMLLGGVMMAMGVVSLGLGRGPARLAVLGGGANVYARMVASALLIAIGMHRLTASGWSRPWRWLALAGGGVALFCAGSKAVVLGLGVALAVRAMWLGRWRHATVAVAATVVFAILPALTHRFVQERPKDLGSVRMLRMPDTDDPKGSYGTRTRYYRESVALIRRQGAWGVGTGDWGPAVGIGFGRFYPHNALLELWCEQGIAGALWAGAFAAWVVTLLRRGRHAPVDRDLVATLVASVVFWILNAQLSGDLLDNRNIWWPMLGLEMVLVSKRRPEPQPVVEPVRLIAPAVPYVVKEPIPALVAQLRARWTCRVA